MYRFADALTGIVVQPLRFNISEEVGCLPTVYSYVGYILKYAPNLVGNVTCLILARELLSKIKSAFL